MKRIFSLCLPLAAGAMLLSQISTANAADPRAARGGGGGRAAAPHVAHAAAPHFAARPSVARAPQRSFAARPVTHRSFTGNSVIAQHRTFNRNVTAQNRTTNRATFNRNATAQNRTTNPASFNRGNRNLALRNNTNANTNRFNAANTAGGNRVNANAAVANNRTANADPRRSMASNQFAFRSGNFHRGWNPGRTYAWNHHHWRNFDGIWAVADVGWPYDWYAYPYPFVYDNTVYYDGDVYDPGTEAQPAVAEGPNNVVSNVQTDLANQGYNPGPVDGVPGPQTEQAISQYQADNGMPATGQIDSALLNSLGL